MKFMNSFILIFIITTFFSCNNSSIIQKQNQNNTQNKESKDSIVFTKEYIQGKLIFEKHCASCHLPPHIKAFDEYLFDHLFQRLPDPSEDYFIRFIENSKALEDSGDRYLMVLKQTYNSRYNHHFKGIITKNEFPNLIYYIKEAPLLKK